jgi:FMN phosphatase YigB (HAD superfamily)
LKILGASGGECILIEDSARNLRPGKALGMTTILIDSDDCVDVDYCVHDILSVRDVVEAAMEQHAARGKVTG